MGMAASQARYLALTARKSNCEYEGQQINQARTVLSNQSANLFNQMLGLTVPTPPSTSDYKKTQYSYSDGLNDSTIDSWQQLSNDPDYNYIVTHYYYVDQYTGSQKKMSDPQVQFSSSDAADLGAQIIAAEQEVRTAQSKYNESVTNYDEAKKQLTEIEKQKSALDTKKSTLSNYATSLDGITSCVTTDTDSTNKYTVTVGDASYEYQLISSLEDEEQATVQEKFQALIDNNALSDTAFSSYYAYKNGDDWTIASGNDLAKLALSTAGESTDLSLATYDSTNVQSQATTYADEGNTISNLLKVANASFKTAETTKATATDNLNEAVQVYEDLNHPTYIGNSELTALATLTDDQETELKQVVSDMTAQNVNASINDCFDDDGNYLGGVYTFKLQGTTYYTTYSDLLNSYENGTGNNNIDGQTKLAYYNATYVSTKVEETQKALMETDGNGRFTSVRFEDDTVTYTLNMETDYDEDAYNDAMNQYYYDSAVYDKTVQDINAKTSIIQQEDQQLELRLKQLDTEQNALSTEIDAVSKVVKDNVEKSFKTFGG
jgi:hypothetical protein